jgi:hypothetical protein
MQTTFIHCHEKTVESSLHGEKQKSFTLDHDQCDKDTDHSVSTSSSVCWDHHFDTSAPVQRLYLQ